MYGSLRVCRSTVTRFLRRPSTRRSAADRITRLIRSFSSGGAAPINDRRLQALISGLLDGTARLLAVLPARRATEDDHVAGAGSPNRKLSLSTSTRSSDSPVSRAAWFPSTDGSRTPQVLMRKVNSRATTTSIGSSRQTSGDGVGRPWPAWRGRGRCGGWPVALGRVGTRPMVAAAFEGCPSRALRALRPRRPRGLEQVDGSGDSLVPTDGAATAPGYREVVPMDR